MFSILKRKKNLINYSRYIFRGGKKIFFSLSLCQGRILCFHILAQYERSRLSMPYQTWIDRSGLGSLLDGPLLPSSVQNENTHSWVNLQVILQNVIMATRWQQFYRGELIGISFLLKTSVHQIGSNTLLLIILNFLVTSGKTVLSVYIWFSDLYIIRLATEIG